MCKIGHFLHSIYEHVLLYNLKSLRNIISLNCCSFALLRSRKWAKQNREELRTRCATRCGTRGGSRKDQAMKNKESQKQQKVELTQKRIPVKQEKASQNREELKTRGGTRKDNSKKSSEKQEQEKIAKQQKEVSMSFISIRFQF